MQASLRSVFVSIASALILFATAASAGKQDITIVNKTGSQIQQIFISTANSKHWEEDVLEKQLLDEDDEFELAFDKSEKSCKWDLKVVYADGDESEWYGLDLCKISRIQLFWDKRRKQTRAVVE